MDESHVLILFAVVAIVIGCFFTMNVIESIHFSSLGAGAADASDMLSEEEACPAL